MFERRLHLLYLVICVVLAAITARLAQLQVWQRTAEDPDAVLHRLVPLQEVPPCRGPLLDRHGEPLAVDEPTLDLALHYREVLLLHALGGNALSDAERRKLTRYLRRHLAAAGREQLPEQEEWRLLVRALTASTVSAEEAAALSDYRRRRVEALSYATGRDNETLLRTVDAIVARVRRLQADLPKVTEVYAETVPHTLVRDISVDAAAQIEADRRLFPGAVVQADRRRVYPQGCFASHVIGYLGRASSPARGEVPEDPTVEPGDRIGITGAEKQFDRLLRGSAGLVNEEPETPGGARVRRVLFPAQAGACVYLSLDRAAQQRAEQELAGQTGAIVVMDLKSGELLVLASSPPYDHTNLGANEQAIAEGRRPFLSRATQDSVPSGSMAKPLVALAAAAAGISPERTFTCTGEYRAGGQVRHCTGQHGLVNMDRAISHSCNSYFFEVGRLIGAGAIYTMARDLGFGHATGIDLPYEMRGRLPNPAATRGWGLGDTLNLSIGQGNLSVTPLQVVVAMGAVATGGKVIRPTILHRIEPTPDPDVYAPPGSPVLAEIPLPAEGLNAVRAGMRDCPIGGTASRVPGLRALRTAVKTGTAQTTDERINQAWIGGYVPCDAPRYAFVVVIHNAAGHGADIAGPPAVAVLETLLRPSGTETR